MLVLMSLSTIYQYMYYQPVFQRAGHAAGVRRRHVHERAHGGRLCAHLSGRPPQVPDAAHCAPFFACLRRLRCCAALRSSPSTRCSGRLRRYGYLCGGADHRAAQRGGPPADRPAHAAHHRRARLLAADGAGASGSVGGHGMDFVRQPGCGYRLAAVGRLCRGRRAGALQPVARTRPAGPGGPARRHRPADRGANGRGSSGGQRLRRLSAHAYAGAHRLAAYARYGVYLHRPEHPGAAGVHASIGCLHGDHARGIGSVPASGQAPL